MNRDHAATSSNGHSIPLEYAPRDRDRSGDSWAWVRKAAGIAALVTIAGAFAALVHYVAPEVKVEADEAILDAQGSHLAVHDKYLQDLDTLLRQIDVRTQHDHDLIQQMAARQGIHPREEVSIP